MFLSESSALTGNCNTSYNNDSKTKSLNDKDKNNIGNYS